MAVVLTAALLLPVHPAPPVTHTHIQKVADQWEQTHPYQFDKRASVTEYKPTLAAAAGPPSGTAPAVAAPSPDTGMGGDVEQWRALVAAYFPADQVDTALRIMACESGGNPNAYNPSGASGLMQVLASWADNFGLTPGQLFDPATNLQVARYLWDDGGWGHWVCA